MQYFKQVQPNRNYLHIGLRTRFLSYIYVTLEGVVQIIHKNMK